MSSEMNDLLIMSMSEKHISITSYYCKERSMLLMKVMDFRFDYSLLRA